MPVSTIRPVVNIYPYLEENVEITFRENGTYKLNLLKAPNHVYYIEVYVSNWMVSLTTKLQDILSRLLNNRAKLGILDTQRFTLVFYIESSLDTYPNIVSAVTKAHESLSHEYPQFDVLCNLHKLVVANFIL
jgi:hypothetical protein